MITGTAANGDVTIGFDVRGPESAPPVVLIQGLGYPRWGWDPVVDDLATTFRIVTLDNRGIGDSSVPPGPYSAREMAADVVAVLDHIGIGRAHVVGASLGGMIAQEVAIDHGHRVDRLVLVCTTPGGEHAHPIPEPTLRLIASAQQMEPAEAMERLVANALAPATVTERPELVAEIVARRLSAPPDPAGWAAQAAAGTGYDGGGRQGRISAPTLIVHGSDDAVVDPRNAEVLARMIPKSRVQMVQAAGHLLFWELPEAFTDGVRRFLDHAGAT